jgi:ABC-type transporter Mla subunit MlaD
VSVDKALRMLDAPARRHLSSVLRTLGRGTESPSSGSDLSASIDGLQRTTSNLRSVADALSGQGRRIATSVTDARLAVTTLNRDAAAARAIVSDGRATLEALAARSRPLEAGVAEMPALLASARRTLDDARPLIRRARPVARDLATAAPPLSAVLNQVPAATRSMDTLLAGLPAVRRQAGPALGAARTVLDLARSTAGPLGDAVRNVEPIARYLSARRRTVAAWFSNTGDLGSNRDAKGYFARFFVSFELGTAFGLPGNFENNAYTGPNDAASNRPDGGYPRLHGYDPNPGRTR